jgi:metal-responsive CopG/Arc/MetJ family transcriptional regulator
MKMSEKRLKLRLRSLKKLRKEYTTVKIPTELARKLDIVARNLGYASRAEVVNDAIRRFIEQRSKIEIGELYKQPALIPSR